MKFTTLVTLAVALYQAQAQNVIADGVIDGFSSGVIKAHNSQIDDAQAKSEVDQLIKYIASNPLVYDILDQAGSSVLVGFDTDSFPAFVTAVLNSANAYEQSPDFTTARSLISQYLPHYDVQQAISNVQSENTLYWGLFTGNVESFTTDPNVASAVSAGSAGVSKLFSDLGIFNTPTSSQAPTSSAQPTSSEASSTQPTSSAEPTTQSSSEASSAQPTSQTSEASTPVSSSQASSQASTPESSSFSTPVSSGNLSSSTEASQFSSQTPVSTNTPITTGSGASSTPVSSGQASPTSSGQASPTSSGQASPTSSGAFVTVSSVESITSTVIQTVTHCSDNKCVTPTISLTTVVPTNPATTVIETVVEGVTVTITVPCDTTTAAGPGPAPSTFVSTYLPTTIVIGTQSLVVTPEPETITVYPTSQGSNAQPTHGGNQGGNGGNQGGNQGGNGGNVVDSDSISSTQYITQVVTQTLTHCDGWFNLNCVTPTVTLTTVVPTNHATAAIQAVVSGNTYTLTVPYDTNTAPPAPRPTNGGNSGGSGNSGNGGNGAIPPAPQPTNGNGGQVQGGSSPQPTVGAQSSNPRNGIQQANGAASVGVSLVGILAGAVVFLL